MAWWNARAYEDQRTPDQVIASKCKIFMEMMQSDHPITASELRKMIERRPRFWKMFDNWLPENGGPMKEG